jgi:hypothetical protein
VKLILRVLLCPFGWHDYQWVDWQTRELSPGNSESWNHECSRCQDEIDLATYLN